MALLDPAAARPSRYYSNFLGHPPNRKSLRDFLVPLISTDSGTSLFWSIEHASLHLAFGHANYRRTWHDNIGL